MASMCQFERYFCPGTTVWKQRWVNAARSLRSRASRTARFPFFMTSPPACRCGRLLLVRLGEPLLVGLEDLELVGVEVFYFLRRPLTSVEQPHHHRQEGVGRAGVALQGAGDERLHHGPLLAHRPSALALPDEDLLVELLQEIGVQVPRTFGACTRVARLARLEARVLGGLAVAHLAVARSALRGRLPLGRHQGASCGEDGWASGISPAAARSAAISSNDFPLSTWTGSSPACSAIRRSATST